MRTFHVDALPGRVVFGAGTARTELAGELHRLGVSRVLLVATTQEQELARALADPLGRILVATFTGVRPHVPVEVAQQARTLAAECRADAVLSIGGGSTTGTAKAVALTTGLPVVAVPTTYAGSEVTPVWGLTEAARKTTGRDLRVLPRVVVYDPELTVSLPPGLSAASGLNALAHCVEALWAPGANPVTSLAAEEGIQVLARGLPGVVADPADLAARADALYGAYLAGSSFAAAGSGLHHKVCHVLGGAYDLPHAETHAVVLPHVLARHVAVLPDVGAQVARALGAGPGGPVRDLVDLSRRLGAPAGLREIGLAEAALPEATDLVLQALPPDLPVDAGRESIAALLRAAWLGSPEEAS